MAKGLDWHKDRIRHDLAAQRHDALQHRALLPVRSTPSTRQAIRGGVMPWGKHKGRRLSCVPQQYLEWLHGVRPPGDALRHAIGNELFRRRHRARVTPG